MQVSPDSPLHRVTAHGQMKQMKQMKHRKILLIRHTSPIGISKLRLVRYTALSSKYLSSVPASSGLSKQETQVIKLRLGQAEHQNFQKVFILFDSEGRGVMVRHRPDFVALMLLTVETLRCDCNRITGTAIDAVRIFDNHTLVDNFT